MQKKINGKVIGITILTVIFIIIAILVQNGKTVAFDKAVTKLVVTNISGDANKILQVITTMGGTVVLPSIIIIATIILICIKKGKYALMIFSNALCSTIMYNIIKQIIQRPRPYPFYFIEETGYSFPSGHATSNMAVFGLLIYFVWTNVKNKKIKILLTILLSLWILIMGITRIYFNVHYPSDIVAGFVLGSICVLLTITVQEKIYKKNFKNSKK